MLAPPDSAGAPSAVLASSPGVGWCFVFWSKFPTVASIPTCELTWVSSTRSVHTPTSQSFSACNCRHFFFFFFSGSIPRLFLVFLASSFFPHLHRFFFKLPLLRTTRGHNPSFSYSSFYELGVGDLCPCELNVGGSYPGRAFLLFLVCHFHFLFAP